MIDLAASLLILLFAWKGFRKGLLSACMDLLGLCVGAVAAYFWVTPLGEWVAQRNADLGVLAYLVASACIFAGVFVLFQVPSWILGRLNRKRQLEGRGSAISAWGGALLNGAVGFAYVLGLLWASMLWMGPRFGADEEETFRTPLQRLSGAAARAMASGLWPDDDGQKGIWRGLADAYVADPGLAAIHLQTLLDHPDVQAILAGADPGEPVWTSAGTTTRVARMVESKSVSEACQGLGVWAAGADRNSKEAALEAHLLHIRAQVNRLRNAPQIRALMTDPDFRRAAEERDLSALLRDPRLVSLWRDLRSGELTLAEPIEPAAQGSAIVQEATDDDQPATPPATDDQPESKKMYRWRDRDGRIYITDEPPPEDAIPL